MLKTLKRLCQGCGRCFMACFRKAISLETGHSQIDPSKCNACGACIEACKQGAIVEDTGKRIQ